MITVCPRCRSDVGGSDLGQLVRVYNGDEGITSACPGCGHRLLWTVRVQRLALDWRDGIGPQPSTSALARCWFRCEACGRSVDGGSAAAVHELQVHGGAQTCWPVEGGGILCE